MNRKSIFIIILVLFLTLISLRDIYAQDENIVISLGEDLKEEQKNEILEIFGAADNAKIIYVTNEEEKKYLGRYIDEDIIGNRAISSAYVKSLDDDSGIDVETYNITWVTKKMYMNALATAGVKNAKVKVASPVKVSGTAALTGIIKAFEDASGEKIGEKEKQVANEEVAKTGQLGEEIGKDKASQLIKEIKEEIIVKNAKDEEQIRRIIIDVTGELNINLNEKQISDIVSLMKNISELNLNIEDIQSQLRGIVNKIKEVTENNQEVRSILQRIIDFIRNLFASLFT